LMAPNTMMIFGWGFRHMKAETGAAMLKSAYPMSPYGTGAARHMAFEHN
jgi:hypothetical protein